MNLPEALAITAIHMRTRKVRGSRSGGDEGLSFSGLRRHVDFNIGIDVLE
jgi:hypothetical protein